MTLNEIMQAHGGEWENDVASVRVRGYVVRLATRVGDTVELAAEGLRAFPDMVLDKPAPKKRANSTPAN